MRFHVFCGMFLMRKSYLYVLLPEGEVYTDEPEGDE